jgi:uncharacterized BrkB/YihY/UPF0761 family membrane protein
MGPLDLLNHLLSFAAPAVAVGLLVALAARILMPRQPKGMNWWAHAALNSIAGVVALTAGLWYFGVDGKMATYGGLVVVVATCQWAFARGWRG